VQSPGSAGLEETAYEVKLKAYLKCVAAAFAKDQRVLAWDICNEPDGMNVGSYGNLQPAE
jgi:hypothetical protein